MNLSLEGNFEKNSKLHYSAAMMTELMQGACPPLLPHHARPEGNAVDEVEESKVWRILSANCHMTRRTRVKINAVKLNTAELTQFVLM